MTLRRCNHALPLPDATGSLNRIASTDLPDKLLLGRNWDHHAVYSVVAFAADEPKEMWGQEELLIFPLVRRFFDFGSGTSSAHA